MVTTDTKTVSRKINDFIEDNAGTIVFCVMVVGMWQVVGIKRSNKALLKAFKNVVQNQDNNTIEMQNIVSSLRKTDVPHTFYPGVGVFVDK